MVDLRTIIASAVIAVSMWLPASAKAEVLSNSWEQLDEIQSGTPECGLGDEYFRVEGMVHTKVSTLRNGMFAINSNAMGTVTPVVGDGEGAMFRTNVSNVYPMMGEREVYNYGESVKVITKGNAPNIRIKINFHVTAIDGEIKSYVDINDVSCE